MKIKRPEIFRQALITITLPHQSGRISSNKPDLNSFNNILIYEKKIIVIDVRAYLCGNARGGTE